MIEYIYDAIKATSGEDIEISAKITDDDGTCITSGCGLRIYDKDEKFITRIEGELIGDMWSFVVPAMTTDGMKGKYWYCICKDGNTIIFRKPLYLV
jgi:hypothetical protein